MMKATNEYFTDVFRLLGTRITRCASATDEASSHAINLKEAVVNSVKPTNVPNYWEVHFHNRVYIEEVDEYVGEGRVFIYIAPQPDDPEIFTFCTSLDTTIVEFQPDPMDEHYLKFKLKHS